MRFDVITLFPELFDAFLKVGITRRAYASGQVDVRLWSLRDHAEGTYRRVDDRPFGGGPGMVMLAEPLLRCLSAIRASQNAEGHTHTPVWMFSPAGQVLHQEQVRTLATCPGAVLLCGRYEGIDQRFIDAHVDAEISLGDFVLSGGELPAQVLLDAVARLQKGVLSDEQSHLQDSFENGLLDCPHYSRPEILSLPEGPQAVPSVLLSGHHGQIAHWRRERSLELTAQRRPDLIRTLRAQGQLSRQDERFLKELGL